MNITNIVTAICSLLFFMIGFDKFFSFLEPPCSMVESIPINVWKGLGFLQLVGGILIWFPKFRKYIAGFFIVFMSFFTVVHLLNSTYDIGGAIFIAALLSLLLWNPSFMSARKA